MHGREPCSREQKVKLELHLFLRPFPTRAATTPLPSSDGEGRRRRSKGSVLFPPSTKSLKSRKWIADCVQHTYPSADRQSPEWSLVAVGLAGWAPQLRTIPLVCVDVRAGRPEHRILVNI